MNLVENLIGNISQQLLQNRRYNYSEDALDQYLQLNPHITCQQAFIYNKRGQSLNVMTIKKKVYFDPYQFNNKQNLNQQSRPITSIASTDVCILYTHGLGSNKLEGLNLVKNLDDKCQFDVCSFDFSGSGKSQGQYTTYGYREQDDINAVLAWLDSQRKYNKYILWGRSMGATAMILSQSKRFHPKTQCIILDSPFCSFERVAIEIAHKNSILPESMLGYIIEPLKSHMKSFHKDKNPFQINLEKQLNRIQSRIMLIYSKNDKIVSYCHSKEISKASMKSPIQLQIQEDHNKPRKKQDYLKTLDFINKSIEIKELQIKRSISKSKGKARGINVSSKQKTTETPKKLKLKSDWKPASYQPFHLTSKQPLHSLSSLDSMQSQQIRTEAEKSENSIRWGNKPNMIKSLLYDKSDIIAKRQTENNKINKFYIQGSKKYNFLD